MWPTVGALWHLYGSLSAFVVPRFLCALHEGLTSWGPLLVFPPGWHSMFVAAHPFLPIHGIRDLSLSLCTCIHTYSCACPCCTVWRFVLCLCTVMWTEDWSSFVFFSSPFLLQFCFLCQTLRRRSSTFLLHCLPKSACCICHCCWCPASKGITYIIYKNINLCLAILFGAKPNTIKEGFNKLLTCLLTLMLMVIPRYKRRVLRKFGAKLWKFSLFLSQY